MSSYARITPCHQCPFRREGGIRLHPDRAEEIANQEGEFHCHETIDYDSSEDGEGRTTPKTQVCAGFLILREKMEQPNQMMRIAERLRIYDAKRLMDGNPAVDEVFDDIDEMLEAQEA